MLILYDSVNYAQCGQVPGTTDCFYYPYMATKKKTIHRRPTGARPGGGAVKKKGSVRGGGGKRGRSGGGGRRFKRAAPREEPRPESEKEIELEGTITNVLAGTMFKVELQNGHEVLAHISGKMRKRFIRLVVGDRVKMEMSPYDKDKARITFRLG
jgi:translation initiation factor IF-1